MLGTRSMTYSKISIIMWIVLVEICLLRHRCLRNICGDGIICRLFIAKILTAGNSKSKLTWRMRKTTLTWDWTWWFKNGVCDSNDKLLPGRSFFRWFALALLGKWLSVRWMCPWGLKIFKESKQHFATFRFNFFETTLPLELMTWSTWSSVSVLIFH